MATTATNHTSDERGFSLIETLIAMAILATGLLSLAGVFIMGLNHLAGSSGALIAREKAREAVESVHTARDTRVITLVPDLQRRFDARHGVRRQRRRASFSAASSRCARRESTGWSTRPTTTTRVCEHEASLSPGPDNILGNGDDVADARSPAITREIEISEIVTNGVANPNLRRLRVRIRYGRMVRNRAGSVEPERVYELTTYISAIS